MLHFLVNIIILVLMIFNDIVMVKKRINENLKHEISKKKIKKNIWNNNTAPLFHSNVFLNNFTNESAK